MAKDFLLAIDQGTTGSTVLVINAKNPKDLKIVGRATVDFQQHYPKPGWVEHDLDEIWFSVRKACQQAVAQAESQDADFSAQKIVSIGITNQRETLCTFERKTGKAIAPAIVWQCRRSTELCAGWREAGLEKNIQAKTGLVLDPYFSGSKMAWLMRENPTVAKSIREGKAVWGTIDAFLLFRLTAGAVFATEPSNASRTLLFDIHKGQYADDLLKLFDIPSTTNLPEVRDSAQVFGTTKGLDFLPDGIPIAGILGDQQAALAGQACFQPGEAKCTYGTGAFLLVNAGSHGVISKAGMLTTVAWSLEGQRTYALEGSSFIAGAAVQFLRDQLGIIPSAQVTQAMARDVIASPEIYFVPALAGLGAPYWNPKARGAFLGLTRGTSNAQIVRATLEGISFQVADLIRAMAKDLAKPIEILRVDGGASANDLLMEMQADFAETVVDRPKNLETTALGAALFAGLGVGLYQSIADLKTARHSEKTFKPEHNETAKAMRLKKLRGWSRAVHAVEVFSRDVD